MDQSGSPPARRAWRLRARINPLAAAYVAPGWRREAELIARYLMAVQTILAAQPGAATRPGEIAQAKGLEPGLWRWTRH